MTETVLNFKVDCLKVRILGEQIEKKNENVDFADKCKMVRNRNRRSFLLSSLPD